VQAGQHDTVCLLALVVEAIQCLGVIFEARALEVLGRADLPIARADFVEWLADREAEDWQPAALEPEF
jgi:hypothetical protein